MTFKRQLSGAERLWLVAGELDPPFANQLVIEGEGELNIEAWRAAVTEASAANPGSRLVLSGHLWWSRWIDSGHPPPVTVVDGSAWDGQSESGADFLTRPLPPKTGPTCEVLLATGPTPRVIIRSHHAVMDGRGHIHFTHDIFRCLRGESPIGAVATTTEIDIVKQFDVVHPVRRKANVAAPTGPSRGDTLGLIWRRHFVPGRYSRLLPRVVVALAKIARENNGDPSVGILFDIPVDMRRHLASASGPENQSTANITGMLHIEVAENATTEEIELKIQQQLENHQYAQFAKEISAARFLPRSLMRGIGVVATRNSHRSSQWLSSGVLSNLGKLEVDAFHTGAFRSHRCFFIPPGMEGTPFFMTLTGNPGGIELCISQPRRLGDDGRLERCLDRLAAVLNDP